MRTIAVSLVLVAAAGCGGAGRAPLAEPVAEPAPQPQVPAAWSASLSKEGKLAYMEHVVVPRMGKVFGAHDAKRYGRFDCENCHGPEGKDPREHLPALVLQGDKLKAFAEAPEVSRFMAERVVPEMASVMGQKPFDPQTKQGFGCGGCHRINKVE